MANNSNTNIVPATGGFNPSTGGVSPAGIVPVPVAGMAALTTAPLAASGVWASGIIYYNGATAVDYQIVSDVPGTFSVVYYDANGNALPFVPANVPYDPTIVKSFGSAFNAKGYGFSFTFTNGATAQTQFLISIGLSQGVQATQQSAVTGVTDTNLALVTKGTLQGKENATGSRKELTGTANGSKFGLDVNVLNPATSQTITGSVAVNNFPASTEISNDIGNPIPVSGTVNANVSFPATQVVSGSVNVGNFPATQAISGTVSVSNFPTNQTVTVSNPTAATDVSALAKESGGNLAAILAKLIAAPATEATLANILTQISAINADQGTPSDSAATSVTGAQSEISLLKAMFILLTNLQQRPGTGTITTPTTTAASSILLAANPLRKGATIYAVTGTVIALAPTCSASAYTTKLSANSYYELPFGYTGIISAFGVAATYTVTELT